MPHSRLRRSTPDIPTKANKVLNLILLAMILIGIRIWHLGVVQHDQKVEESQKPQRRVIVEPAKRASIRDRFNIPLAINTMRFQATLLYSQIQQIPSIAWEKDVTTGKKTKVYKRKEYIAKLAHLLGEELEMDASHLEDLIYSKAIYYTHLPFIIKEEISEAKYYRLKMLEKDWPGIHVRQIPKRFYPQGKVGGDIIGYMGAINRQEYETVLHEMKALQEFLVQYEEGIDQEFPKGMDRVSQVRKRLKILQQKAYSIHDYVGKTGIEGNFEEELRGFQGKKTYFSDSRGNFLRELPGSRDPLPGHRFLLTISSELQEYAEKLLAQNEDIRKVRMTKLGEEKRTILTDRYPWIKGGAIVAMDPNNGEILALASYPRFDPNDFIGSGEEDLQAEKQANIYRWLENESFLADLWDQKHPLQRERWDPLLNEFYEEPRYLTWNTYLNFLFPPENEVKIALDGMLNLKEGIGFQQNLNGLLKMFPQHDIHAVLNALYHSEDHISHPINLSSHEQLALEAILKEHKKEIDSLKKKIDPIFNHISYNYNKVLFSDVCRLIAVSDHFSEELLNQIGVQKISSYHDASGSFISIKKIVLKMAKELFHEISFKEWRKVHEKAFLKEKREWEKSAKKYPTPYIDYLDKEEDLQFKTFWNEHQNSFLLAFLLGSRPDFFDEEMKPYFDLFLSWHDELKQGAHQAVIWLDKYLLLQKAMKGLSSTLSVQYLQTLRGYRDLSRPLLGKYRFLRSKPNEATEKHLAAAFHPKYGFSYGRSHAYRQSTVQGSIFKMITAYEALVQRFNKLGKKNPSSSELNPLTMVDHVYKQGSAWYVGATQEGKPLPQIYQGGRLPRSQMTNIGEIELLKALEVSSNPYFALLASDHLNDPQDLAKAAYQFSYGNKTGIDLPGELKGVVPNDLHKNKTGLYAFSIGQHSLIVTPLQTAVVLSAIANGGKVLKPKIVSRTAGYRQDGDIERIPCLPIFPLQESLQTVGVDFPLFTALLREEEKNLVMCVETEVKRQLFMPEIVRSILLQAMKRMVRRTQSDGIKSLKKLYTKNPEAIEDYISLKEEIVGKSSTSEVVERIDLDKDHGVNIYTHVWFGGIAFESSPEIESKTFVFQDRFEKPELVVIVYLRYGGFGKEAAPVAAQVVKKWREIKLKHQHCNSK